MIGPQTMHRFAPAGLLTSALFISLVVVGPVQGADSYEGLLASLQGRQPRLEAELSDRRRCLGERLDGFLEINDNCPPEARSLAEDENRDRTALHRLMSRDLKLGTEQVGQERASRYVDRYRPGVLREVRLSEHETTWWDGLPPDPRKTAISRVLAVQYARIYERPDAASPVVRDNVQQYESFGVVDSARDSGGQPWYQVTEDYVPKVKPPGWSPRVLGWLSAGQSIPWRRAVVMRFTNPLRRDPSLFFAKPEPLLDLIRSAPLDRQARDKDLRAGIARGNGQAGGVIAVEPQVNPGQERIIMYPVLDFFGQGQGTDLRIDGKSARVLEVAARTRGGDGEKGAGRAAHIPIDILFVMDTTESMGPYLQNVLEAAETFAQTGGNDGLRFGFVGYRDKHSAFEYEAREFTQGTQPAADFVQTLRGVRVQPFVVKGDDIPESVFEGLDLALESSQWRRNAVKVIFLVGDAPGKDAKHNLRRLRDKADTRKISLFAFHIKNSAVSSGLDNESERQYRGLSSTYQGAYGTSRETSHFLSIDARSTAFGDLVLERFREGQQAIESLRVAVRRGADSLPSVVPGSLSELIFQQAILLLADASMPSNEVRGWVCDKVLTNPDSEALAPMVLLSETEFDELESRVRELKDVGELALRGEGGTTLDFFDLVARNTRITMVDPTAVNFRDAFAIPLGVDQLPYDSDIMSMTREEFQNLDRVQDFVRSMTTKLRHYEDLRRKRGDPQIWKKLSTGAREQDRVVGVELNQLP